METRYFQRESYADSPTDTIDRSSNQERLFPGGNVKFSTNYRDLRLQPRSCIHLWKTRTLALRYARISLLKDETEERVQISEDDWTRAPALQTAELSLSSLSFLHAPLSCARSRHYHVLTRWLPSLLSLSFSRSKPASFSFSCSMFLLSRSGFYLKLFHSFEGNRLPSFYIQYSYISENSAFFLCFFFFAKRPRSFYFHLIRSYEHAFPFLALVPSNACTQRTLSSVHTEKKACTYCTNLFTKYRKFSRMLRCYKLWHIIVSYLMFRTTNAYW